MDLLRTVGERLRQWLNLRNQRRILLQLDDHILKDIGLSRVDALREGTRSGWDGSINNDQTLRINVKRSKVISTPTEVERSSVGREVPCEGQHC